MKTKYIFLTCFVALIICCCTPTKADSEKHYNPVLMEISKRWFETSDKDETRNKIWGDMQKNKNLINGLEKVDIIKLFGEPKGISPNGNDFGYPLTGGYYIQFHFDDTGHVKYFEVE